MRRVLSALAVCLVLSVSPAAAQLISRERVPLVAANVSTGQNQVFGGTYIVTQACSTYGTVTVRYRDPNGTMIALITKTAADTAGGTQINIGSDQIIDATVAGTTGCNVAIARVPA